MSTRGLVGKDKTTMQKIDIGFFRLSKRMMPRQSMRAITALIRKEWESKIDSGKKIKLFMRKQDEVLYGKKK